MSAAGALLFDLDGTLTDNYLGIARSIRYALERLGADEPDEATLRRCVGPPLRVSFAALLDTDDAATIEHAIALYRERFADLGWRENLVYEGIPEAMTALAATSRPIYLCTSKPGIYARRIVQLFGLSEFLRGVYGADLAGRLDDKVALLAHLAASSGVASRPLALKSRNIATPGSVRSSCERITVCMSVSITPGRSETARNVASRTSAASTLVSISRPAFAAQ